MLRPSSVRLLLDLTDLLDVFGETLEERRDPAPDGGSPAPGT